MNKLLLNSDIKSICDPIHLLLPINQLQHLIIEEILDHMIINKGKIYLDLE